MRITGVLFMTLEEAIVFLKNYVKESAVPGQMHISPDLVNAEDMDKFEEAMRITNNTVVKGEMTRDELQSKLGLA